MTSPFLRFKMEIQTKTLLRFPINGTCSESPTNHTDLFEYKHDTFSPLSNCIFILCPLLHTQNYIYLNCLLEWVSIDYV